MCLDIERLIRDAVTDRVDALEDKNSVEAVIEEISGIALSPIRALCDVAGPKSNRVNAGIARILGRIASRRAIPALAGLIEDSDSDNKMVRHAAMRALAQIGGVEALDVIEGAAIDPNTELSKIQVESAMRIRKNLAFQFAGQAEPEPLAENEQPEFTYRPKQTSNVVEDVYSLVDLTPERVRALVVDELMAHQSVDRFYLIHHISRMFGRNYLIRVRQYVNRSIYPMAQHGRITIDGDLIAWNG